MVSTVFDPFVTFLGTGSGTGSETEGNVITPIAGQFLYVVPTKIISEVVAVNRLPIFVVK